MPKEYRSEFLSKENYRNASTFSLAGSSDNNIEWRLILSSDKIVYLSYLHMPSTYINTHLILVHQVYSQFPEITNATIITLRQEEENPISAFPQRKTVCFGITVATEGHEDNICRTWYLRKHHNICMRVLCSIYEETFSVKCLYLD